MMTFQAMYRGMLLLLAVGGTAILQSSAAPEKKDRSVAEKVESFVERLEELIDGQVGGDKDDTMDMMEKNGSDLTEEFGGESWLPQKRQVGTCRRRGSWQRTDGELKFVSVGPSGVWGVNSDDEIFYRTGTYGKESSLGTGWVRIGGALKQISSGKNIVWGVNSGDYIFIRLGISSSSPQGSGWKPIAGKLKQVHVSSTSNQVWGVNSGDDIFRRTGITESNPAGTGWQHIAGKLKFVSVGPAGVWGVNSKDQIFYRTGTSGNEASAGTGWVQVSGGLKQITSGNGEVWGVNGKDEIFVRCGLSAGTPQGSSWQPIEGELKEVYISSSSNQVLGVNEDDEIYQRLWQRPGPLRVCEHKTLTISCPAGRQINILSALYGRTSQGFCPNSQIRTTNCRSPNSLVRVRGSCQGRSSCSVRASNSVFGDPCVGTFKYLEVSYTCGKPVPLTEQIVKKYAPKVWLAKGETYNPSSVAFHLQNVKVYDGNRAFSSTPSTLTKCSENCYMSSNQRLDEASDTLPFFSGERVTSSYQPPVYAVAKQINPTTTDIFYWMFYPYNRGKRVRVGIPVLDIFFDKCVDDDGYCTFGNHVGDWEHMKIRLENGQPISIYVSAHDFGGEYYWDAASQTYNKPGDVVRTDGTHPVLYSAMGSHGLWSTPGTHTYKEFLSFPFLQDETSAGTAWDTWKNVPFTMHRPDGGYTGSWTWLHFKGRWGNRKRDCYKLAEGECILNDGPTSINYRSNWNSCL